MSYGTVREYVLPQTAILRCVKLPTTLEFVFTFHYIFSLNSVSAIYGLLIHHTSVFSINYSVYNR